MAGLVTLVMGQELAKLGRPWFKRKKKKSKPLNTKRSRMAEGQAWPRLHSQPRLSVLEPVRTARARTRVLDPVGRQSVGWVPSEPGESTWEGSRQGQGLGGAALQVHRAPEEGAPDARHQGRWAEPHASPSPAC